MGEDDRRDCVHAGCGWMLQLWVWASGPTNHTHPSRFSCAADVTHCPNACPAQSPAVSAEGTPTILYTGVRLRSSPTSLPPPPADQDAGLLWIETQCAAVPEDPGGGGAERWQDASASC